MAAGWTEDMDEVWADTEPVSLDEEGDSVVRIDYSPGCECLGRAWAPGADAGFGLALSMRVGLKA